jgi:hypothetical protein
MQLFLGLCIAALIATGGASGVFGPVVRWLTILVLGEDVGI